MFQSYHPVQYDPELLDNLLSEGWFRGGNVMYQSKMLYLDESVYSVVNIRSNLSNYSFPKRLRKLLRKNKERFSYSIQPLRITIDKERLYKEQSKKFRGFVHDNLDNYLHEGLPYNNFNTFELTVFDGDKLVAASFFDLGKTSIASLLGIYSEAYSKYSLGIFTMLLELEFAIAEGYKYYYPGYVFKGMSLFDYKLRMGQVEYFDWKGEWQKLEKIEQTEFPADQLSKAFTELEAQLNSACIPFEKYLYPFFSLGYMPHFEIDFLHSIQFIQLGEMDKYGKLMLVHYDCEYAYYSVFEVQDQNDLNLLNMSSFSEEIQNSNCYFQKLLSIEQILFKSRKSLDIINFLKRKIKAE